MSLPACNTVHKFKMKICVTEVAKRKKKQTFQRGGVLFMFMESLFMKSVLVSCAYLLFFFFYSYAMHALWDIKICFKEDTNHDNNFLFPSCIYIIYVKFVE